MFVVAGLVVVIAIGIGISVVAGGRASTSAAERESASSSGSKAGQATRVTVTKPLTHGIEKKTVQPGSIHAYESADLYAKVSGYLIKQTVDYGSRVKQGELLAVIDVPELVKAVEQAQAAVEQANAQAEQAKARIKTAEADNEAALAQVKQSEVDVEKSESELDYRTKERKRIQDLARLNSIEQKLVDEQEDRFKASTAAKHAADASVLTSKALVRAAEAKIDQAKADYAAARANIDVARANLAKAKVLAEYTHISSPYTGVVTLRNFYRGDFIRSAEGGNERPLLSVARTDRVKVWIKVPDTDVPYLSTDDPAEVHIDALPGKVFKGKVSRYADSEDPEDRTMHTEIDLDNAKDLLRPGMYGQVVIELEPPSKNLSIPSSAVVEAKSNGDAIVYVVRDSIAYRTPVTVGKDDGVHVEILKGLSPDDQVVIKYNGAIADKAPVEAEQAQTSSSAAG